MFCSLLQELLGFMFPALFLEGSMQHRQLASKPRRRIYAAICRVTHERPVSPHGDAQMSRGEPFDDAIDLDLDPQHPIVSVTIICDPGPGIDGIT